MDAILNGGRSSGKNCTFSKLACVTRCENIEKLRYTVYAYVSYLFGELDLFIEVYNLKCLKNLELIDNYGQGKLGNVELHLWSFLESRKKRYSTLS